jgi:hypothetical protein
MKTRNRPLLLTCAAATFACGSTLDVDHSNLGSGVGEDSPEIDTIGSPSGSRDADDAATGTAEDGADASDGVVEAPPTWCTNEPVVVDVTWTFTGPTPVCEPGAPCVMPESRPTGAADGSTWIISAERDPDVYLGGPVIRHHLDAEGMILSVDELQVASSDGGFPGEISIARDGTLWITLSSDYNVEVHRFTSDGTPSGEPVVFHGRSRRAQRSLASGELMLGFGQGLAKLSSDAEPTELLNLNDTIEQFSTSSFNASGNSTTCSFLFDENRRRHVAHSVTGEMLWETDEEMGCDGAMRDDGSSVWLEYPEPVSPPENQAASTIELARLDAQGGLVQRARIGTVRTRDFQYAPPAVGPDGSVYIAGRMLIEDKPKAAIHKLTTNDECTTYVLRDSPTDSIWNLQFGADGGLLVAKRATVARVDLPNH